MITVFRKERGLHFVGEVLFRWIFPTLLMYLIDFRRPDRLVCDHTQNDGLVRRLFLQCRVWPTAELSIVYPT